MIFYVILFHDFSTNILYYNFSEIASEYRFAGVLFASIFLAFHCLF